MTTIGVSPQHVSTIYPLEMPSYSYTYPSLRRVKLAGVKETIYHPRLPTFRHIDRDNELQKMPEYHCRSSTYCTPMAFRKETSTMFLAPPRKLDSLDITATGRKWHHLQTSPEDLRLTKLEWNTFLDKCPERYQLPLPPVHRREDMHFNGYAVRYLNPSIPANWKQNLVSEPRIDQYGQKPVPQNTLQRHRQANATHHPNVSLYPYCPPKTLPTRNPNKPPQ